ncbi:hypothetical protein CSUB01_05952 [Colletotrichum sublineola]|uniref:Uncharacterized protein n=1 Tax=Colletotrichum sublineola TaxID=1173701 RepID=A0A066X431_COLSU|nr:hypothetical protein CSUB01_05952 [Colletotrichum sublineola]
MLSAIPISLTYQGRVCRSGAAWVFRERQKEDEENILFVSSSLVQYDEDYREEVQRLIEEHRRLSTARSQRLEQLREAMDHITAIDKQIETIMAAQVQAQSDANSRRSEIEELFEIFQKNLIAVRNLEDLNQSKALIQQIKQYFDVRSASRSTECTQPSETTEPSLIHEFVDEISYTPDTATGRMR